MKHKEFHTYYNFQFKHTAVTITQHACIQANHVAEALGTHPIMLYRWRQEMREGKIEDNQKDVPEVICFLGWLLRLENAIKESTAYNMEYIRFYYGERLHSGLNCHTPEEIERLAA